MSNHFGSFWLESYPLFAVYFAAKPPLPRRGLLRFGACAAVYQSLGSDLQKAQSRGNMHCPFKKIHQNQKLDATSTGWTINKLPFPEMMMQVADPHICVHETSSTAINQNSFMLFHCLETVPHWLWFHPGQKHPHPFCSVTNSSSSNTGTAYCVVTRNGVSKPCLNVFPTKISEPEAGLCTSNSFFQTYAQFCWDHDLFMNIRSHRGVYASWTV